jgi:hypothetical protein
MGVKFMKIAYNKLAKNIFVSVVIGLITFGSLLKHFPNPISVALGVLACILIFAFMNKVATLTFDYVKPVFKYTDAQGVYCNGESEVKFDWADVVELEIVTTDKGPYEDDFWWVFLLSNESHVAISGNSESIDTIFDCIVNFLGQPDWENITVATGSCENAFFKVWKRAG